jgi:hypothetical protein
MATIPCVLSSELESLLTEPVEPMPAVTFLSLFISSPPLGLIPARNARQALSNARFRGAPARRAVAALFTNQKEVAIKLSTQY